MKLASLFVASVAPNENNSSCSGSTGRFGQGLSTYPASVFVCIQIEMWNYVPRYGSPLTYALPTSSVSDRGERGIPYGKGYVVRQGNLIY